MSVSTYDHFRERERVGGRRFDCCGDRERCCVVCILLCWVVSGRCRDYCEFVGCFVSAVFMYPCLRWIRAIKSQAGK